MLKADTHIVRKLKNMDTIYVALSGGVDSIAGTHFIRHALKMKNVTAIHVKHNIDKIRSDNMEKACRRFVEECDIGKIEVHDIDFDYENGSLEEWARKRRYEIFQKYDHMVVFHHADDIMENVFLGLLRKKSVFGWTIKKLVKIGNTEVIRPFVNSSKKDLEEYCKRNGLKKYIYEDESNNDISFDRNWLRKEFKKWKKRFPLLTNPENISSLAEEIETLCEDLAKIDIEASFRFDEKGTTIDLSYFNNKQHRLKNCLLYLSHERGKKMNKKILLDILDKIGKEKTLILENF